jgi:hypothetical protein
MKYANGRRIFLAGAAILVGGASLTTTSPISHADGREHRQRSRCSQLPGHATLESALGAAVATETSGLT